MRFHPAFAIAVVAAAVFVGCGGGGGSGSGSSGSAGTAPTAAPTDPIQLFLVPAADASGGPVLEPTPGTFGVTNLSVSFTAVGQQQGVLVYEPGFNGTFSANPQNCTPASPLPITVVPASTTGVRSAIFVVTAAAAGFCDVKIIDGVNGAAILVDVTTTTGTISGVKRH